MMTVDEMKLQKIKKNYSFSYISKNSGIPMGTLQKIFGGITKTPRYETMLQLERFFRIEEREEQFQTTQQEYEANYECPKQYVDQEMVCETVAYGVEQKKQGEYSVSDCDAMPDEARVELIDGVLYDMSGPTIAHQMIANLMCSQLHAYIQSNRGKCVAATAPLDVQLDNDEKTLVQPDLILVCDRNKFSWKRMHGAPDMVVEILSPATRKRDCFLKLSKYMAAGVKEYWIIDPDKLQIVVYQQDEVETYLPRIYTFENQVPVQVYGGALEIDFVSIWKEIKFLYEKENKI